MITDDKMTTVPNEALERLGSQIASNSLGLLSTMGLGYQPLVGGEAQVLKMEEADLPRTMMMWGLMMEALKDIEQAAGFYGTLVMRELGRDRFRPHHAALGHVPPVGWMPPNMLKIADFCRRVDRLSADVKSNEPSRDGVLNGSIHSAVKAWARKAVVLAGVVQDDGPHEGWAFDQEASLVTDHVMYRLGLRHDAGATQAQHTHELVERGVRLAAPDHIRELMPMGGQGAEGLPPRYAAMVAQLHTHFRGQVKEDEYVLLGSAPLAVRGIRDVEDLDVLLHPRAMARLGYAPDVERTVLDVSVDDVKGVAQISPLLTPFYGPGVGQITPMAVYFTTEWWYGQPILDISIATALKEGRALDKDHEDVRAMGAYVPKNPFRGQP